MKKMNYEKPMVELVEFDCKDVITTSGEETTNMDIVGPEL